MQPIHLLPPIEDENHLEELLRIPVFDYLCHRCLYTTDSGKRGLATVFRDAFGHMTVRRVTPGHLETATGLRNWLELAVWLDMGFLNSEWMRDLEEEEKYRSADRNHIGR